MIRVFLDVYEAGNNVQSINFISFDEFEANEKMDELYGRCEDHPNDVEWVMSGYSGERHILWWIELPEWNVKDLGNKPDINTYRFDELPMSVQDEKRKTYMDSLVDGLGFTTDQAKNMIDKELRFMSNGDIFKPMWAYSPQIAAAITDGLYKTP